MPDTDIILRSPRNAYDVPRKECLETARIWLVVARDKTDHTTPLFSKIISLIGEIETIQKTTT